MFSRSWDVPYYVSFAIKDDAQGRGQFNIDANMSPTIYGGPESLASQSLPHLTFPEPFTGCNAGYTSFHVDPYGRASICKIGREPNIPLLDEGLGGLHRLGGMADSLLRRQGGCAGCTWVDARVLPDVQDVAPVIDHPVDELLLLDQVSLLAPVVIGR